MIRVAQESDLAMIVDIYNAAIPDRLATADLTPVSVHSQRSWFFSHDARYPLWVLEHNQAIAGWIGLQPFYGRLAYQKTAEVSIYIAPSFQRQGLGKVLLSHLIQTGPSLSICTLLGFIFGHNQPSLSLFNQFGFQPWGLLPRVAELDGVERDLVILGLRLVI